VNSTITSQNHYGSAQDQLDAALRGEVTREQLDEACIPLMEYIFGTTGLARHQGCSRSLAPFQLTLCLPPVQPFRRPPALRLSLLLLLPGLNRRQLTRATRQYLLRSRRLSHSFWALSFHSMHSDEEHNGKTEDRKSCTY
jgi:hypothetical protein